MGSPMNKLHPLFRAAFDDLRDGNAALARAASKGKLNPDGSRMSYLRTRDDDDPYYLSPEEEKQMEADAEVERLHTENDRLLSVIVDLKEALEAFCDTAKLREAVMMTGAHLSQQHACDIIEEDRLGIRAALIKAREKTEEQRLLEEQP